MASEYLDGLYNKIKRVIEVNGVRDEHIDALIKYGAYAIDKENDRTAGLEILAYAKSVLDDVIKTKTKGTIFDLDKYCKERGVSFVYLNMYYKIWLIEAQNMVLDSYLLYLERKRDYREKFYQPRRKQLLKVGLIDGLQKMLNDEIDILSLSMPPSTGKTSLEKFFTSGVMGWFPEDYNLFFSHSSDITRMYYDGVLDIISNESEYCWSEIFPTRKISSTNAKMEQINIDKYKPFPNLQCTTKGSNNSGKVRCSKFLLCDDLIGGIEEALNKNQLDKLWEIYSVDARQRKTPTCKEIHIATRWSVHDVIGRLQRIYEGDDRCLFIAVPDIDPITDKSNFDYEINGFSEEFFHQQELIMDEISYRCLYKNDPIEREGLLYHEDEIRTYLELPQREPDAILGVCDTKSKGTDFLVLPVMYQYGEDYYMEDTICSDSSDYGVQYGRMSDLIVFHNMQQCEFESNAGGDRVAFEVDKLVQEKGGRCNITTKPTETNKETRIIVNADWVKKHVLFKDKSMYTAKSDYGVFMSWMFSYSVAGKNTHDDVVDCLANFALYATRGKKVAKIEVIQNPFSSMGGLW